MTSRHFEATRLLGPDERRRGLVRHQLAMLHELATQAASEGFGLSGQVVWEIEANHRVPDRHHPVTRIALRCNGTRLKIEERVL